MPHNSRLFKLLLVTTKSLASSEKCTASRSSRNNPAASPSLRLQVAQHISQQSEAVSMFFIADATSAALFATSKFSCVSSNARASLPNKVIRPSPARQSATRLLANGFIDPPTVPKPTHLGQTLIQDVPASPQVPVA